MANNCKRGNFEVRRDRNRRLKMRLDEVRDWQSRHFCRFGVPRSRSFVTVTVRKRSSLHFHARPRRSSVTVAPISQIQIGR